MVRGAALFSAGPPLVAAALGERVTAEELGGAELQTRQSGVAHNLAESEDDAFALARAYLSLLPGSAWARPPRETWWPSAMEVLLDALEIRTASAP